MRLFVSKSMLDREAIPHPDIKVSPDVQMQATSYEKVMLTGATGFLGMNILNALMERTTATVYCLVRSKKDEAAVNRLNKQLSKHSLEHYIGNPRIQVIEGDLDMPMLGLDEKQYDFLVHHIDAIYHNGANVNYFFSYGTLKEANVTSTETLLRIAATHKLKALHYVSTLFLFFPIDPEGKQVVHEQDQPQNGAVLNIGYGQSKWVSDRMVRHAQERGLPATIYRVTRMSGDTRVGVCNNDDFIWLLVMISIQIQCRPQIQMKLNFAPVNFVGDSIVELSLQKCAGHVFHVANPHSITMDELFDHIGELGYPLPAKPLEEWKSDVSNFAKRTDNQGFGFFIDILNQMPEGGDRQYDVPQLIERLEGTGVACPVIDRSFISSNLKYYVERHQRTVTL